MALPVTAALGIENGHLEADDHVALLGIGSGINVVMLGLKWQKSPLEITSPDVDPDRAAEAPAQA